MKKRNKQRKFSRKIGPRKAFLKSLIRSLLKYGKIKTTEIRAKEISRITEKFITKAKKGDLSSIRSLERFFSDKNLVKKTTKEIAPEYKERKGGYTRIIKLGPRKSDGAEMAIIELVRKYEKK